MDDSDWARARGELTRPIVTMLSDFGLRDPFVGVMKGVLLGECPSVTLVDITHDIEPQAVAAGAFWLGQAFAWFPRGTVHLAVVDPGVGTARRAIVARAGAHCFVAPDNGLLEVVRRRAPSFEARLIDAPGLGLTVPSRTFHGRDLFAPVAGRLASGSLSFADVGPLAELSESSLVPEPRRAERAAAGQVLVVDRFGNLVTNLDGLPPSALSKATVRVLGRSLAVVETYADLAVGECGAVVGSFGQLEVVVRDGSAARELGAKAGTPVLVDW